MGQPHAGAVANAGWPGRRVPVVRVSEGVGRGQATVRARRQLARHAPSRGQALRFGRDSPALCARGRARNGPRSGSIMNDEDFWSRLASLVADGSVVVDRPKGSAHPRLPGLIYPLDYGYLTGLRSGDGDGVDVWIGSLKRQAITGI